MTKSANWLVTWTDTGRTKEAASGAEATAIAENCDPRDRPVQVEYVGSGIVAHIGDDGIWHNGPAPAPAPRHRIKADTETTVFKAGHEPMADFPMVRVFALEPGFIRLQIRARGPVDEKRTGPARTGFSTATLDAGTLRQVIGALQQGQDYLIRQERRKGEADG